MWVVDYLAESLSHSMTKYFPVDYVSLDNINIKNQCLSNAEYIIHLQYCFHSYFSRVHTPPRHIPGVVEVTLSYKSKQFCKGK